MPAASTTRFRFTFHVIWLSLTALLGTLLYANCKLDIPSLLIEVPPIALLIAGIAGATRYTCRAFPYRRYPIWRVVIVHFTDSVIAASVVMGTTWLFVEGLTMIGVGIVPIHTSDGLMIVFTVTLLAFLWSVTYNYLIAAVAETVRAENQVLESELLASDAELKVLRAKLNPHFLFNALNSIAALTSIDAARAREMCISLSEFMRQSLTLGSRRSVPLRDEMALIRAYLQVEQVRFQDKMTVAASLEPGTLDLEVPPLLLQPLVENAVKHGIAAMEEAGEVHIDATHDDDSVIIIVENPLAEDTPPHTGCGQGLSIVERRVKSYFGARGEVRHERMTTAGGDRFRVTLSLPLEKE